MKNHRFFASNLLLLTLFASAAWASPQHATVTSVHGSAQVRGAEGDRPATVGMELLPEQQLSTGPDSGMDIALGGLVGCRLLPETNCKIVQDDGKSMSVSVSQGNVILNLKKLPADTGFRLETPTAVAAVRGTQFWGRVLAPGDPAADVTTFAVRQGAIRITIKSSGQTVDLSEGQALDIPRNEALPQIRPALAGELQAMSGASDIATSV